MAEKFFQYPETPFLLTGPIGMFASTAKPDVYTPPGADKPNIAYKLPFVFDNLDDARTPGNAKYNNGLDFVSVCEAVLADYKTKRMADMTGKVLGEAKKAAERPVFAEEYDKDGELTGRHTLVIQRKTAIASPGDPSPRGVFAISRFDETGRTHLSDHIELGAGSNVTAVGTIVPYYGFGVWGLSFRLQKFKVNTLVVGAAADDDSDMSEFGTEPAVGGDAEDF